MVFKKGDPAPPTCYKKGHIPWNYGKHRSEETKRKISASHKGKKLSEEHKRKISIVKKGKTLSKETKRKISISNKGKHRTEETRRRISETKRGENHPNYGKHLSEETRRKISEANKGKKNHMYGKHQSEEVKTKLRKKRLNQVFPVKDTAIETAIQEELDKRNIKYKKQIPVCSICQPDIVFPDLKLAVFADGNYWHSKDFKNGKAWNKDRYQDEQLIKNGWRFLRFWGSEIREDVEACVDRIVEELVMSGGACV